ncbi:MAG: DNA repair protein RecN, partial [Acidimicrobiales bacterium]
SSHAELAAELGAARERATQEVAQAEAQVAAARRNAAAPLARAVEDGLRELAMPRARFEVEVAGRAGEDVTFMFCANPGEPLRPLAKAASGGELSRTMLALRLALRRSGRAEPDPPWRRTMVFDEVDAGIGGEAALAVGGALAALARDHQVLVVTHLPQVAAFADHQLGVAKVVEGGRTATRVSTLDDTERILELTRMMSGGPASPAARRHAEELLEAAVSSRSAT